MSLFGLSAGEMERLLPSGSIDEDVRRFIIDSVTWSIKCAVESTPPQFQIYALYPDRWTPAHTALFGRLARESGHSVYDFHLGCRLDYRATRDLTDSMHR